MSEENNQKPIQLSKPTDLVCEESTETTIKVSWKAVERIDNFLNNK